MAPVCNHGSPSKLWGTRRVLKAWPSEAQTIFHNNAMMCLPFTLSLSQLLVDAVSYLRDIKWCFECKNTQENSVDIEPDIEED